MGDQLTALDEVSEMGNLTDFSQASGPNNDRGGVDGSERARLVRVDSQMSDYSTCNFSTVNANSSNSGALPPPAGALPPPAGTHHLKLSADLQNTNNNHPTASNNN